MAAAEQQHLRALIDGSRKLVVFTGAGISTDSGIPDFRSPNGLWTKMQPVDFSEYVRSEEARRIAWRQKAMMDTTVASAEPNRGHHAVAELVRSGRCIAVITQNVDGLHQRAGVPDDSVIELHGNATYAICLSCQRRHELAPLMAVFARDERPPVCDRCGGIVKSATISFGQPMPEIPMKRAEAVTLDCDLFLVLGSSLVVYPAASFPRIAAENGAKLVIVNREETELDGLAAVVFRGGISELLDSAI